MKEINTGSTMEVLPVQKYNALAMRQYCIDFDQAVKEGKDHPQQAFYGFYTRNGNFKTTGYVAFTKNNVNKLAILRLTKSQAIKDYKLSK